jgi:hypothetical protein
MSRKDKTTKGAEKAGKAVGKGIKKGWGAVKSFGKAVKEGVKEDK